MSGFLIHEGDSNGHKPHTRCTRCTTQRHRSAVVLQTDSGLHYIIGMHTRSTAGITQLVWVVYPLIVEVLHIHSSGTCPGTPTNSCRRLLCSLLSEVARLILVGRKHLLPVLLANPLSELAKDPSVMGVRFHLSRPRSRGSCFRGERCTATAVASIW